MKAFSPGSRAAQPGRRVRCGLGAAASIAALTTMTVVPAHAQASKAAEDPTKISTRVGLSYSDEASVSGSFAFGEKFKINGRISESGLWSAGASYLFPVAILTFSAARSSFDSGVEQTRYSLGGFVPLNDLGVETGQWRLFVPFGYTYTSGHGPVLEEDASDVMPIEMSSNSGYFGVFAMRPISDRLTFLAGANVSAGTNDFSGFGVSGGLSYHLTARDTLGLQAGYVDNSFGQNQKVTISYRHEF